MVVVEREKLKLGDHIYSWRLGGYAHHGIFVDEDKVIHYLPAAGREVGTGTKLDHVISRSSPNSPKPPCEICGDQSQASGVISSCLDCFLTGGKLYLFEYGVSKSYFLSKVGGTCTTDKSDGSDNVIYRASFLLENGFGPYNLLKNNCEDFAIYCKTGKKQLWIRSGQASSFVVAALNVGVPMGAACLIAGVTALTPLGLFGLIPVGFAATYSCAAYCMGRLNLDKGDPVPLTNPQLIHQRFSAMHQRPPSSIHHRPRPTHQPPSSFHHRPSSIHQFQAGRQPMRFH